MCQGSRNSEDDERRCGAPLYLAADSDVRIATWLTVAAAVLIVVLIILALLGPQT